MLDKLALIRSVTSPFGVHNFAVQYLMTGYKPTPALEYPSIASVVAHLQPQSGVLPSNIAIPNLTSRDAASIGNGFLPNSTKHFSLGSDPGKSSYKVRDLDFYQGLDISRARPPSQNRQCDERIRQPQIQKPVAPVILIWSVPTT